MRILVLGDVSTCVTKAYPSSATKAQLPVLIGNLELSPQTSDYGVIVISANQANPKSNPAIHQAFVKKHRDIIVIYFYRHDREKAYMDDVPGVISFKVSHYKEAIIKEKIDSVLGDKELSEKIINMSGYNEVSSDIGNAYNPYRRFDGNPEPLGQATEDPVVEDSFGQQASEFDPEAGSWELPSRNDALARESAPEIPGSLTRGLGLAGLPDTDTGYDNFPDDDDEQSIGMGNYLPPVPTSDADDSSGDYYHSGEPDPVVLPFGSVDNPSPQPKASEPLISYTNNDRHDVMRKAIQTLDTEALRNSLNNNILHRELLQQSVEYQSTIQHIQMIDGLISECFRNPQMSYTEKLGRIKQLASERVIYRTLRYDGLVKKYLNTLDMMASIAQETIEEQLEATRVRFGGLDVVNLYYSERDALDDVIRNRLECQLRLATAISNLQNIYLLFDDTKDKIITEMNDDKPTLHPIINDSLEGSRDAYTPHNVAQLVEELMNGVSDRRITFSAIQGEIVKVINEVFTLQDINTQVIDKTTRLNKLLEVNRVEAAIISTDILKYKLRGFTGPSNVGRTVTALGAAMALARVENTLLIDLSTVPKLGNYVKGTLTLEEFYEGHQVKKLLCVQRTPGTDVSLYTLQENLKRCTTHFSWILVIVSNDDAAVLSWMYSNSLSANFITTPNQMHLEETKGMLLNFTEENTARIVTLVGSQLEPVVVCEYLDIDGYTSRIVNVPLFPEIQTATLKGKNPCDNPDVLDFFIEMVRP